MKKFIDWWQSFTINVSVPARIGIAILIVIIIAGSVLGGLFGSQLTESSSPEDKNVYLNEEVCFAKDIYIKVTGISVDINDSVQSQNDDDGDLLSDYTLNLTLIIEQRSEKKAQNVTMKSDMFTLKSVNLKSTSKMEIFFEQLAQATLSAMLSAVSGSVNVIEETINFAGNYATEVSKNVSTEKKFKPIQATQNQFEPFKPKDIERQTEVNLSFPIKQEYLESENTIVLTVDSCNRLERKIYLIVRPEQNEE